MKRATRDKTETKTGQVTNTDIGKQKETISSGESKRQEAEETEMVIREYDTDKPADSITGKPPLKKEIYKVKRKVKDESTLGEYTEKTQTALRQETEFSQQVNQDVRAEEKKQTGISGKLLLLLTLILLIITAVFWKPIKTLLKKIIDKWKI